MKNEPKSNKVGAEDGIAINELTNATDYLKKVLYFLENRDIEYRWKWIAICYSSAFYSMVITVMTWDNLGNAYNVERVERIIAQKKAEAAGRKQRISDAEISKLRDKYLYGDKAQLIGFEEAFAKCQSNNWMAQEFCGKRFKLTPQAKKAIQEIKDWRDAFIHFKPKTLIFSKNNIIKPVKESLKLLRFVFLEAEPSIYQFRGHPSMAEMDEILGGIEKRIVQEESD
ncbi:MAG: hypothetical protein NT002_14595 [candidate division Zixibacteria bacterium]|nr:hypothetical protein [candidate division Zixibacteria bacterium]